MRLELATFEVKDVVFGPRTALQDGTLSIDREELQRLLLEDENLRNVEIELARPGEETRIIHVLDALEPRLKVTGPGYTFPGFLGPPRTVGEGRTHRLAGLAILESAQFPVDPKGLLTAREAIVDMSGPAAPYCLFSETLNVVLVFTPVEGLPNDEYDNAMRRAGLKAAVYLAESTRGQPADWVDTYELGEVDPALPRVAYINQVQSQGLFAQTFIYGKNVNDLLPTIIHPNEFLDTAVVSGVYVYGCVKNPTYLHCNHPVIKELYRRHGRELNFAGVVVSKGHNYSYMWKERSANYAANLAKLLRADGVILTQEGGGNANIDLMLTIKACEQLGIKTTFITFEYGGADGSDQPLVSSVPEADAIVSTGGQDHLLELPPMKKVIGGSEVRGYGVKANEGFTIVLEQVYTAVNQLGAGKVVARPY
ncbi:MAG: glycine/sarcosine/betaine reductase component B subunit [Chloroflexi bacterium]|nr:glycine/sarcosine/betaine reductase component B subunit [Chloroflexota bacterium]MCL5075966.1 glycine/sarcosine/betaine reductase component B subunit [Chloroflexota bacterium]